MPITGQESTLTSALTAAITAAVEAKFGGSIQSPEYIDALSQGIANAIIPFLVSNTQVDIGQSVPGLGLIDSKGGDVTGIATVSTPGTIS